MFWGIVMRWTKHEMYLVDQEGTEIAVDDTTKSMKLWLVERYDVGRSD
jgi:hypothetical protein